MYAITNKMMTKNIVLERKESDTKSKVSLRFIVLGFCCEVKFQVAQQMLTAIW